MKIKKGQLLFIKDSRKGNFYGKAIRDFDTDIDEFYPIYYDDVGKKQGLSILNEWQRGDEIPCRKSLCKIQLISEIK